MRAFRITQHSVVKDKTQGKSLNRILKTMQIKSEVLEQNMRSQFYC